MDEPQPRLVECVDNTALLLAIREKLKPFADPSLQGTEEEDAILEDLGGTCDTTLTPFREFLETELSEYDYKYNDIIGFEEGKWSAEVYLLLDPGVSFTGNDIELIREIGRPIHVLVVALSLIAPVYLMSIERWELSTTRVNWIDCIPANASVGRYSLPVLKCGEYLKGAGFCAMPRESLGIAIPRQMIADKIVLGAEPREFTLVQLLFNELYDSDLETLPFVDRPLGDGTDSI